MAENETKAVEAQVEAKDTQRTVPYWSATCLGLAAMSWSMMNQMNSSMWAYFMTDIALIATGMMATILFISKFMEWVGGVLAGIVMERVMLKWGKYGSWCVVIPPIMALAIVMMFIKPPFEGVLMGVWFGLWYSVLTFGAAFVTATQTTMVALMGAKSRQDRAFCATKRAQGSQLGQFLFGLIGLPLIMLFNGGDRSAPLGYPILALIFGIVCIVAYQLLYRNIPEGLDTVYATKEERKAAMSGANAKDKVGIGEMFVLLFKTPPMLGIIISDTCRILAQFVMLGTALYIFTYIYQDPDAFAPMMSSMGIVALLMTFVVEFLIRFINNRVLYVGGLLIFALGLGAAYFVPTSALHVICVAASYIGIGLANSQGTAMVGDAAIYCEWRHRREVKAFMGAMGAMPPKFASVISGAILGFGLVAIGYEANTQMSAETLNGLKMIGTLAPALILIIGVVCFLLLNRLNATKVKQMNEEVMAWRAEQEAAAAAGETA